MNKRQSIPFIVLLVVFLVWLYFKPETILPEPPKHKLSYIAYDANNTHFDENGEIAHEIFSDKTTNFDEQNITLFENPKVIVYIANKQNNQRTVWQISSENGILYQNNKLLLSNNVLLENLSLDQIVQTMSTEKMIILLAEKEISSDQQVTWQGPQMQQQGVGMWASLVTEELIVKDQIKAVYFNEKK